MKLQSSLSAVVTSLFLRRSAQADLEGRDRACRRFPDGEGGVAVQERAGGLSGGEAAAAELKVPGASAMIAQATGAWAWLGFGLLAVVGAYVPLFPGLIHEWSSYPNLSHGFAVPFIAGYLVWSRRQTLAHLSLSPSWMGLPLLGLGMAILVAGVLGGESFVARVSLPLSLLGGAVLMGGWRVAREAFAGIAYLIFMIPLPYVTLSELTDRVRFFDATVTASVLPWLGVPVFQEGYLLHLPNMTLEVAEVCSSIPAIASFLALAAAYGYVNGRPALVQGVLILSAVPFGILSNIIRITTTAAGVYYIGPIAIQNAVHLWNGLTVFLLTLVFLVALDAVLARFVRRGAF